MSSLVLGVRGEFCHIDNSSGVCNIFILISSYFPQIISDQIFFRMLKLGIYEWFTIMGCPIFF